MYFRLTLHKILPKIIIFFIRKQKKRKRFKKLSNDAKSGKVISTEDLIRDLRNCGLKHGDSVLVHSSMSKIGFLEDGSITLINALKEVISDNGNILMPSSPNAKLQLDYIRENKIFDVRNSPSRLGIITETFRKSPGVIRSLHPTEPVCVLGKDAFFLTEGHFNSITPYTVDSPFGRLSQLNGKILYIGVTLANAGTSLHTLEDSVNFKLPVYFDEIFNVELIDYDGVSNIVNTKVHNPYFSNLRKCDELIPLFIKEGVCEKVLIGKAESYIFDARKMLDCMMSSYENKGITMYTPKGF